MSYCRFSSCNWRSDVYVYADCRGGWTTHVARLRARFQPLPGPPLHRFPSFGGEWNKAERRMDYPSRWHALAARVVFGFAAKWSDLSMWTRGLIPLRPIGLSHDGECFNDPTAAACADTLEMLKREGYFVPDFAIKALREELPEEEPA